MDVSVVIVSYNTSKLLDECIESVGAETSVSHEIIVIDNASIDDTVTMINEKHPGVTLIQNSGNDGFARANNQGFKAAKGRYLLMLNPDTVILDKAIDRLVEFMDKHKESGACGPRNVGSDGTLQHNCHHFPTLLMRLVECLQLKRRYPQNSFFGREHMTYWKYDEIKDVDWITGCSLLIRRQALEEVGLLDENYFMYAEETDLCYRLNKKGWKTTFLPHASILHYGGQSALSQDNEKVFSKSVTSYLFTTRYYFIRKNYGILNYFGIKTLDAVYYLIIILKNLFRSDKIVKASRIEEAKTVLSLILK